VKVITVFQLSVPNSSSNDAGSSNKVGEVTVHIKTFMSSCSKLEFSFAIRRNRKNEQGRTTVLSVKTLPNANHSNTWPAQTVSALPQQAHVCYLADLER